MNSARTWCEEGEIIHLNSSYNPVSRSRTESLFDKYRFGVRRDQPHNFWLLIFGLFNELKYAVRTKNYINAHYATK